MAVHLFKNIPAPVGVLANHSEYGIVEILSRDGDQREIETVLYNDLGECLGLSSAWVLASDLVVVKDHIEKGVYSI